MAAYKGDFPQPLVLTNHNIREVVDEIYRKFCLHTENISIHFDRWGIQILVFPHPGAPFILPDGPIDVRLHAGGKQEYINLPEHE